MLFLHPDRADAQLEWRTLMVLGFLLVVAGELALCCVTMGPAASAGGPLGWVLLGAGALHLYAPMRNAAWVRRHVQSVAAAAYVGAGAWLILSPPARAPEVMPLLAGGFIGGGAFQIHFALAQRGLQWEWAALSGGITAILGVLMLAAWPRAGIETVAQFSALELFVAGSGCLALARCGWQGRRNEVPTDNGEAAMGFDQREGLVFVVSRGADESWDVREKGFDQPLATFDQRQEACDYAHGLARLKAGSLVISDPPDDPPGLSFA